jgi:putative FmdB family regulatory protein
MPFFNYKCNHCQTEYEELILGNDNPKCPNCEKTTKQKQQVSSPAMFTGNLTNGRASIKERK